jgi:hypothetical protein
MVAPTTFQNKPGNALLTSCGRYGLAKGELNGDGLEVVAPHRDVNYWFHLVATTQLGQNRGSPE